MFEASDSAVKNLKAYMEARNLSSALRVALMTGG